MPDSQNTTGTDNTPRGGQGFPAPNPDGTPALIGKDDFTRQYEMERLNRGNVTVLSGNYADLQLIGAALAKGQSLGANTVGVAGGIDPKDDNVLTPPEHDAAKGEVTVVSVNAGLNDFPPAPTPPENKEPDSIDPTSVSPRPADSPSQSPSSPAPQSATKK